MKILVTVAGLIAAFCATFAVTAALATNTPPNEECEEIVVVEEIWANFSPNDSQATFIGPAIWPNDARGTWQIHDDIPGGHAGPDGVYAKGNPAKGGNWFYRQNEVVELDCPEPDPVEVTAGVTFTDGDCENLPFVDVLEVEGVVYTLDGNPLSDGELPYGSSGVVVAHDEANDDDVELVGQTEFPFEFTFDPTSCEEPPPPPPDEPDKPNKPDQPDVTPETPNNPEVITSAPESL